MSPPILVSSYLTFSPLPSSRCTSASLLGSLFSAALSVPVVEAQAPHFGAFPLRSTVLFVARTFLPEVDAQTLPFRAIRQPVIFKSNQKK